MSSIFTRAVVRGRANPRHTLFRRMAALVPHPAMVAAVTALGLAALLEMENEWFTMPFSIAVFASIAAALFLVSRRLAFSVYAAWALLASVTVVSFIKFREQGFGLHAYDVVFVARDASLHRFLIKDYPHLVAPVALLAAAGIAGLATVAILDRRRRVGFRARLAALVGIAAMLPVTIPATAAVDRHEYIVGGHHASSFFVSLLDFGNLFGPTALEERLAAMPPEEPLADIVACAPPERQPDVIVVLSETQSPPFRFPQLGLRHDFADGFRSDDGKQRELRVETMGGGTWITNFSLMSGLSAADFGWQRPYLTIELEGRIGGALPELFARCGYRTVAITPVDYNFVNEGPFLESIGFESVLDARALDAGSDRLRDGFYFEAANRLIAEHRRADGRPLFLEVQTMFPHGPHKERLSPDAHVDGEPLNPDPELAEYLRRVALSRADFREFLAVQRGEATSRGVAVLEFGDHQASATLRFVEEIEGPAPLGDPDSLVYATHYTVHGLGYDFVEPMPDFPTLDIPYLGPSFVRAAGLASSPLIEDLIRLRDACNGRFHACKDRALVDRHLKRRIASGMLRTGTEAGPGS